MLIELNTVQLFQDGLPNLREPLSSTIVHCHYQHMIYIARPIAFISNWSASRQCDDGLNRDLDNLLCMAKCVMQVRAHGNVTTNKSFRNISQTTVHKILAGEYYGKSKLIQIYILIV